MGGQIGDAYLGMVFDTPDCCKLVHVWVGRDCTMVDSSCREIWLEPIIPWIQK